MRYMRYYVCNRTTNHRGLSGVNLLLNNLWVMYKYYNRNGWPKGSPYTKPWRYRRNILKALITGWAPWQLTIRKRHNHG